MSKERLFEMCVVCTLVHRDTFFEDDASVNKAHFHWKPSKGEVAPFHATVCVECLGRVFKVTHAGVTSWLDVPAWLRRGWSRTDEKFRRDGRLNASLPHVPQKVQKMLDSLYQRWCALFADDGFFDELPEEQPAAKKQGREYKLPPSGRYCTDCERPLDGDFDPGCAKCADYLGFCACCNMRHKRELCSRCFEEGKSRT